MRARICGVGFPAAVLMLAFAVALWALPARAITLDRVVAVVNDEAITWLELHDAMKKEMAPALEGLTQAQADAVLRESESAYLNKMVYKKVQLQEARRLGITATDKDVRSAVESIRQKYGLDNESFREAIAREGFTWSRYLATLADEITISRLVDTQVRARLNPTDEDVRRALGGGDPGAVSYRLSQIFFPAGMEGLERMTNAVMRQIEAGADFAELARSYSAGPAARAGGDLGLIAQDDLTGEFRQALKGLVPGEVSRPFTTSGGTHIIMLRQKHDARELAREKLFGIMYSEWLEDLMERSNVNVRL